MKMRATENFAYGTEQGESWVYGGTVLDEDDPIVRAFPGMFEPVYETVSNPAPVSEGGPAHGPESAVRSPGQAVRRRRNG